MFLRRKNFMNLGVFKVNPCISHNVMSMSIFKLQIYSHFLHGKAKKGRKIGRLWRGVTRGLAGYPSPMTGDEAKYVVEAIGRKVTKKLQGKEFAPSFFEGDVKKWMKFKYELV